MEADLSRYHHLDLRDLWRRGPDGRRLLTLRQVAVRVRFLPPESASMQALDGLSVTDVLLMDIYQALTDQEHPGRPKPGKRDVDPKRAQTRARARMRAQQRRRAIAVGEIT